MHKKVLAFFGDACALPYYLFPRSTYKKKKNHSCKMVVKRRNTVLKIVS